jgi:hypothetical protein
MGIGDIPQECRTLSQKSTLRIRFRFNQQTGVRTDRQELQRASGRFAQSIVEQVGLQYADNAFKDLQSRIGASLQGDVRNEIEHVARQFRKFIVGSTGARSSRADLTTSTSNARGTGPLRTEIEGLRSASVGGTFWTPRKKRYLTEKRQKVGHNRWFEHQGELSKGIRNGSTWTNAFGPISIKVQRVKSISGLANTLDFGGKSLTPRDANVFGGRAKGTFSVARIEVSAFGKITPAMLPALITGKMDAPIPSDGRTTGLIGLLGNANPALAYRLGGGPNVPYRPTLEPFLAFALTRAIPSAVFNRIQAGMGTDTQIRNYAWR